MRSRQAPNKTETLELQSSKAQGKPNIWPQDSEQGNKELLKKHKPNGLI